MAEVSQVGWLVRARTLEASARPEVAGRASSVASSGLAASRAVWRASVQGMFIRAPVV
jgi:hypothetical protein